SFEGYSSYSYICPAGVPTIGWGHALREGERIGEPLDKAAAEQLLHEDVAQAQDAVARLVTVPLQVWERAALVSFTFNLGAGALQRSTLRRRLNRGEYDAVPQEMRRWVFAGGRKLPGLVRRREAEARLWNGEE